MWEKVEIVFEHGVIWLYAIGVPAMVISIPFWPW
jgi:hypothetical protein